MLAQKMMPEKLDEVTPCFHDWQDEHHSYRAGYVQVTHLLEYARRLKSGAMVFHLTTGDASIAVFICAHTLVLGPRHCQNNVQSAPFALFKA